LAAPADDRGAAAGNRRRPHRGAGYQRYLDYNAKSQDGFGYYQVNQKNGRRDSAGQWIRQSFRAQGEVILAAGAAQTPQLMELSGIGSPEILRKLGIGVNHALPGVGEIIPITSAPA